MIRILLVALLGWFAAAQAQPYPSKPVRIVVPFPPAGAADLLTRALGKKLNETWQQPVIADNRPGAGGNIGAEAVAKAGDPHVLLVGGNGPVAINKHLYRGLSYDPDSLVPVSLLASAPQMLVAKPQIADFKSFLERARANPGRLSYASVGSGSASHLTMELLKSDARVFILHIPYRGFPQAATDMLAGDIDAMFAIVPAVLPHVRAGRMKAIAVTGLKRSELAPEVPSVAELGYPQLESLAWNGLLAPPGTSPAVVTRLVGETVNAMRHAQTRETLGRLGFDVVASSPEEFARWIRAESEKWARVIRTSGATAD